ncbi:MAG: DNA polymerase III subunit gamma/tau [Chthoniobacteraceae bacterium]
MSYTVFARKYRPRTFDEVIGQDHIVRTLKNAIAQERLAHAYIFVGPRGTGKTSTARILAKALNCTDGPKVDFDPDEPVCREIAEGRSMNVLEFDAASNTQVDKIRDIIIDNVKYAPVGGKYKVYVVDEVHMLSTSSFNALLKTLEEPPSHVVFIFATTDVQKVPTTILSRCQRFDLKRIPTALIRDHLLFIAGKEGIALASAAAEAVARGAEGGMRDAESMLDQLVAFCGDKIDEPDVLRVFGFTSQQTIAQLCEQLLAGDASAALRTVHAEAEAGRDLTRLLGDFIAHLRSLLVSQADPDALREELSPETLATVRDQAGRIDQARLLDLIERCAEAEQRMKWAPNKKMHLEIAVIRAIQTLSQATLGEVLDALSAMRGGAPAPAPKPAPQKPAQPERKPPQAAAVEAPAAKPETPAPRPAPAPAFVEKSPAIAEAPEPPLDPASLWSALIQRVRRERPLQAANIERAVLLEVRGGSATIGIDANDALAFELLDTPANHKLFDSLLGEIAGRPITVKFIKRAGIAPAVATEAVPPENPAADFRDDPLIRKALEIFKAEIQPA